MAEEKVLEQAPEQVPGFEPAPKEDPAPDAPGGLSPAENPRNAVLARIAKQTFAAHEAEVAENAKIPVTDDEGNVVNQPAAAPSEPDAPPPEQEEPPASSQAEPSAADAGEQPPQEPAPAPKPGEEVIDPAKDYTIVVEGQNVVVKGKAIIDAGYRTFQKETAADFRLRTASQLLEEAERRIAAAPAGQPAPAAELEAPAGEPNEAQLAEMLQFGTKEQSAAAVKVLLQRGTEPNRILQLAGDAARAAVRDELEFARGKSLIAREFSDVMAKEPLRRLFFSEEERRRQAGDKRPYAELYKDIGDSIRKDFNLPRPTAKPATPPAASRVERKAKAPSVPRMAAARIEAAPAEKPKNPSDIIAGMAAARGKNRLTNLRKE